tara:strand:- start:68 stop:514 length:447 start_codon:yes stop_codon:yes gene_type:complete
MEKFSNINELIVALLIWITSNSDYKNPQKDINVEFLKQSQLSELACKRDCEILAYTPIEPKYKIYLSDKLDPIDNICDRGILLHEIIHVLQEEQKKFAENDERTRKHLREMEALVNHNIYLSQFGKKILYSNGFAAKFKTQTKNNLYC